MREGGKESEEARREGVWDGVISKVALLEAEFLLRRSVTIVRDTSAINSSRSLMIQNMCISV